MPLTRDFRMTVKERAQEDVAFRAALLTEAVEQLLSGDVSAGKHILRDLINATIGFEKLAADLGKPTKSLMRMFSARGNPTAENLFAVISHLQKTTGVSLMVAAA